MNCDIILVKCKNIFIMSMIKTGRSVQKLCRLFNLRAFQNLTRLSPEQTDLVEKTLRRRSLPT